VACSWDSDLSLEPLTPSAVLSDCFFTWQVLEPREKAVRFIVWETPEEHVLQPFVILKLPQILNGKSLRFKNSVEVIAYRITNRCKSLRSSVLTLV